MKSVNYERRGSPVLLVEQLLAWRMYRSGEPMQQIAFRIRRSVRETRAMLAGEPA